MYNTSSVDPSLIMYYTFEPSTINGIQVANMATGAPVYDATLLNGCKNSLNTYKIGSSSLYLNNTAINPKIVLSPATLNATAIPSAANSSITMAYWIYALDYANLYTIDFAKTTNQNANNIIHHTARYPDTNSSYVSIIIYPDITIAHSFIQSKQVIPLNTWTHIVWISTNDTNKTNYIYINGVLSTTTNMFYPSSVTRNGNYIGGTNYPNSGFNGYIDDLRFYSRGLSSQEIVSLYNYAPILNKI